METESPVTFVFGSSTYNLPSKGSGDDDEDPDERKPPSKPLTSTHTAPKKRKPNYPRLNRKGKPPIDQLLEWAIGAIEALKDSGIPGDWSKLEQGVTSSHQNIVEARSGPKDQIGRLYSYFQGYLNQIDGHLADAENTSSVEPPTGFGSKRADARDKSGALVDYKSHGQKTGDSGQSNLRSSLQNYLLTGETVRLPFRNGIPTWAYGIAREEAPKAVFFSTTVYFNQTLVIDRGLYVGPGMGGFVTHRTVPQPSSTSSSNNNSAPSVPTTSAPPPPPPAMKQTQSQPEPKKAKTSSKSGTGQSNTMLNYFSKKPDNDKDPPGTKT